MASLSRFNTVAPELLHPNHPRSSKPREWHAANDCLVVVGKLRESLDLNYNPRPDLLPHLATNSENSKSHAPKA